MFYFLGKIAWLLLTPYQDEQAPFFPHASTDDCVRISPKAVTCCSADVGLRLLVGADRHGMIWCTEIRACIS